MIPVPRCAVAKTVTPKRSGAKTAEPKRPGAKAEEPKQPKTARAKMAPSKCPVPLPEKSYTYIGENEA